MKGTFRATAILLLLTALSSDRFAAAQQTENISPKGTRFFLYTPPGYPGGGPYPLLVSLHGQVGIGNDLEEILKSQDHSPAKLIHLGRWPQDRPFIVLSPQLKRDPSIPDPRDQNWDPKTIDEVVEHVRSAYNVDATRIYFVGLSLGATGVWLYAAAYPHKVAAMVPMSGVPDSTTGCFVKDIPSWVFHGAGDGLVVPRFATGMVNAINSCQPKGKYISHLTMMEARKHDGLWSDVYNYTSGHRIYEWLLQFRKNNSGNVSPYAHAGNDLKVVPRSTSYYLNGYYFDSDGVVSKVEWRQTQGEPLSIQGKDSFLKINGLFPGTFEFELSVTDNDGGVSTDRVLLEVVDNTSPLPRVNDLILFNPTTGQDIGKLSDGYIVNPGQLGTRVLNIRAGANATALSVRFRINDDHNTRTTNTPGPYLLTGRDWKMEDGEYLVCATPFDDRGGRGNTGISQCHKIIVGNAGGDPPGDEEDPTHFFAAAGSDISKLTAWKNNPDGTGASPTSFTAGGLTFEIRHEVFLNEPLTLAGDAKFFIGSGGVLHLNNSLSAQIDVGKNGKLIVNTSANVSLGTLDAQSTVALENAATAIPLASFGNLTLRGESKLKTLPAGTTLIRGTLSIAANTGLKGNPGNPSVAELKADLYIDEAAIFDNEATASLAFTSPDIQRLSFGGERASFEEIMVGTGTILHFESNNPEATIEVGSSRGGGIAISSGATLRPGSAHLRVVRKGTLNVSRDGGQLYMSGSALSIESSSERNHYLNSSPSGNSISLLTVDISGSGQLFVETPFTIEKKIQLEQGIVHSDGNLHLAADSEHAAFVSSAGSGRIEGDVGVDIRVPQGSQQRLLSFPVDGISVSELQQFVPVTGTFEGTDAAASPPSLFEYDPNLSEWIAYPKQSNSEMLIQGRGYRITFPNTDHHHMLSISGNIIAGDFEFELNPNHSAESESGWNLIGNPFTAPMLWNNEGWTSTDLSDAVYVLDDSYPGGRYLVWDGEFGDPEFGGRIARGQAFFVRATGSNPTLRASQRATSETSGHLFRAMSEEASLVITLSASGLVDKAYLRFPDGGNDSLDNADAVKMPNGYFNVATLTSAGVPLAINSSSSTLCGKRIPLSVYGLGPGTFTLAVQGNFPKGLTEVQLIDHHTLDTVSLADDDDTYNFQVTADQSTQGDERLEIMLTPSNAMTPTIAQEAGVLTSNFTAGNQWILNGEEIGGATGQTFIPFISGTYSVRVTQAGCSWTSAPVSFIVTGLEARESMTIFPNPASEEIHLSRPGGSPVAYSILDSNGAVVVEGRVDRSNTINVNTLPTGAYILILSDGKKVTKSRMIIR